MGVIRFGLTFFICLLGLIGTNFIFLGKDRAVVGFYSYLCNLKAMELMMKRANGIVAVLIAAAVMSFIACDKSSKTADSQDGQLPEAEVIANEPVVYEAEPDENEGEVWADIGGTYPYSRGDTVIIVTSLGRESSVNINGEDFKAAIDAVTGRINAMDDDGKLVFSGFMYNGATVLKGNLRGDSIRFEGMIEL